MCKTANFLAENCKSNTISKKKIQVYNLLKCPEIDSTCSEKFWILKW